MTIHHRVAPLLAALLGATALAACGRPEAASDAADQAPPAVDGSQITAPTVTAPTVVAPSGGAGVAPLTNAGMNAKAAVGFKDLVDGAEVSSPIKVCLSATGVTIEKSSEVRAGHGHHHILVNPSVQELKAITEGTMTSPLVKDETHVHLGDGSDCSDLNLAPGNYQLMAVVADGSHVPLSPPVFNQVNITVTAP